MKKSLQYIPFLLILTITILLFVKVNQHGKNAAFGESPVIGKMIPNEMVETIIPSNGKIDAASYKGKYTVVNLFASWCVACVHEHQFIKMLQGSEANVVGIAWRDKKEETLRWLERNGNPYDVVGSDSDGKYGIYLGVTGIPETYVVDGEGKIIMHFAGPVGEAEVKKIKKIVSK